MTRLSERSLLEEAVSSARLMQVATVAEAGSPAICHVWFRADYAPDRLLFISRRDRWHSMNLKADPRVAVGIVIHQPAELGERVRGVTAEGRAHEVTSGHFSERAESFISRWPRAAHALMPVPGEAGQTPSGLYEIEIASWILFDEVNFPDNPRVPISPL